ncbi:MAG: hypothetical protein JRH15_21050 [Deltaproteobacteria bacterium]|nr:hypothetical protein [Deltaproteobacteria bacterium]
MRLNQKISILAGLVCIVAFSSAEADISWETTKTLELEATQQDMTVSNDGSRIFILTKTGKVLVYAPSGQLIDTIDVDDHVTGIEAGPKGDFLLLSSPRNRTVQVLSLDFRKKIDTAGSPFLGVADAPVVIAVFMDYQ